jgi:integrase/recombinase XerC
VREGALAFTVIRLSDAAGLRRRDVDLRRRELILRRTKGGSPGRRDLPARLLPVLARLVDNPQPAGPRADAPVFAGERGGPLSPRAIRYRFAFWLRRARTGRALSVHSLRHTFGTLLYRATKDLVLVSRALGHRDVTSTQRYAHLDDRRLARAVNGLWELAPPPPAACASAWTPALPALQTRIRSGTLTGAGNASTLAPERRAPIDFGGWAP